MKIPLHITCPKCSKLQFVWMQFRDSDIKYICANPSCRNEHSASFTIEAMRPGWRLMLRSQYELTETRDYSLSIVMSAAAIDVDLTRLNHKWKSIAQLNIGPRDVSSRQELEKEMTRHKKTIERLKETGHLLNPEGFDSYVRKSAVYKKVITGGFENIDLNCPAKSFIRELFWPRNEILHRGREIYSEKEAISCYNTARLGLNILWDMDLERRKKDF